MVFNTDKFLSLVVHSPTMRNDFQCTITFDQNEPKLNSTNPFDGMSRLAAISSKVLDITRSKTPAYSLVMQVDQELNVFGHQIPSEPLSIPAVPITSKDKEQGRARQKLAGENLMKLQFHQARLMLHMPYMLRSITEPGMEYSRTSCLEAARNMLLLFQSHRRSEVVEKLSSFRTSPTDWIGFIAAATLIIGQIGNVESARQFAEDRSLVDSTIELYRRMPTMLAGQSARELLGLSQLRDNPSRDRRKPTKITLPVFGDIVIPGALHHRLPQQCD
jgi:hypothetical protein